MAVLVIDGTYRQAMYDFLLVFLSLGSIVVKL